MVKRAESLHPRNGDERVGFAQSDTSKDKGGGSNANKS
jgi:hypothetical protein